MENALDWLRSNDATKDFSMDDISVASWKRRRSALRVEIIEEEKRTKDMESAIDAAGKYDEASVMLFKTLGSRSNFLASIPEQADELNNALDWLRKNEDKSLKGLDDMSDIESFMSPDTKSGRPKTEEELLAL